jgi:hypothetical protein
MIKTVAMLNFNEGTYPIKKVLAMPTNKVEQSFCNFKILFEKPVKLIAHKELVYGTWATHESKLFFEKNFEDFQYCTEVLNMKASLIIAKKILLNPKKENFPLHKCGIDDYYIIHEIRIIENDTKCDRNHSPPVAQST